MMANEAESLVDGTSPLDFSVKSVACDKRSSPSHASKEQIKVESFPLDLSVKRSSAAGNAPSPAKPSQSAHPRQQPPPNALAKFPSRSSEQRNLSPPPSLSPRVNGVDKKTTATFTSPLAARATSSHGRQNPWQTQWISRSSEQTRDVFTCVWCKESFRSLQEMTLHMKESPRCGMAGMQHAAAASLSSAQQLPSAPQANGSKRPTQLQAPAPTVKEPMSNAVLAKNNVTLPRKLVRGQDVWLGRGVEQTRQILKCK